MGIALLVRPGSCSSNSFNKIDLHSNDIIEDNSCEEPDQIWGLQKSFAFTGMTLKAI